MGKRKASDDDFRLLNLYRNKALKLEDLRELKAAAEEAEAAAKAAKKILKKAEKDLGKIEKNIEAAQEEKAAEADSYIDSSSVEASGCVIEADSQTS